MICSEGSDPGDLLFVCKVAALARAILPKDVKICLHKHCSFSDEKLIQDLYLADVSMGFYKASSIQMAQMYILHNAIADLGEGSTFPKDHIIDAGRDFQNFLSLDPEQVPMFCLEEGEIAEEFENLFLKNYSSVVPQRALFMTGPGALVQNSERLLFFVSAALYAQRLPTFSLYLPGADFLNKTLFDIFIEELLSMVFKHPEKPMRIQCIFPQTPSDDLREDENNKESLVSRFTVDIEGGKVRRTLQIIFPGKLSIQDVKKLYWLIQGQQLGDTTFSEWLSLSPICLQHLIELAQKKGLENVENFLREFSQEECKKFATAWLDPKVREEAKLLRELIKQERNSLQLLEGRLSSLRNAIENAD